MLPAAEEQAFTDESEEISVDFRTLYDETFRALRKWTCLEQLPSLPDWNSKRVSCNLTPSFISRCRISSSAAAATDFISVGGKSFLCD